MNTSFDFDHTSIDSTNNVAVIMKHIPDELERISSELEKIHLALGNTGSYKLENISAYDYYKIVCMKNKYMSYKNKIMQTLDHISNCVDRFEPEGCN